MLGAILVSLQRRVPAWRLVGAGVLLLLGSWGWAHEDARLTPRRWCVSTSREGAGAGASRSVGPAADAHSRVPGKVVLLTSPTARVLRCARSSPRPWSTLQQRPTAAERQQVFFSVTAQPEVDTRQCCPPTPTASASTSPSWAFVTGPPRRPGGVAGVRAHGEATHPGEWWIIPLGHF